MVFKRDLAIWRKAEIDFAKVLLSTREVYSLEFPQGKFKDYDIKINTPLWEETYEIKLDLQAPETGNFVVEYRGWWKASWIFTSKADYIIYNVLWEWWWQERGELILRLINLEDKEEAKWWDGKKTDMWKIKCKYLPDLFDKIDTDEPRKETSESSDEAR